MSLGSVQIMWQLSYSSGCPSNSAGIQNCSHFSTTFLVILQSSYSSIQFTGLEVFASYCIQQNEETIEENAHTCYVFIYSFMYLEDLFICLKGREELSSICWLTFHMAASLRDGSGGSLEPGSPSGRHTGSEGPKDSDHPLLLSRSVTKELDRQWNDIQLGDPACR